MSGYEPRFDRDYTYGLQGELLIGELLQQIAAGQASYEVKRPRRADDILYVELQQHPPGQGWKWSGLAVTTADYWVYLKPGPTGNGEPNGGGGEPATHEKNSPLPMD